MKGMLQMKLLTISADPKTVKGEKRGYLTAIMYLAPYKVAGINVCPMAEVAECQHACLNTAGRGGMAKANATMAPYGFNVPDNAVQNARINRTRLYADDRAHFIDKLKIELFKFAIRADKLGLIPAVRLNGTSDIDWSIRANGEIMQCFPSITFYDYTKVIKRAYKDQPKNYVLSLSYSQANFNYAADCLKAHDVTGINLVYVMRNEGDKQKAIEYANAHAVNFPGSKHRIDGDIDDLRFLDPQNSIVYLRAKGAARRDTTGFVLDYS